MEKRLFELTHDEARAVIGGAIYYASVNKLPTAAPAPTTSRASVPAHNFDTLAVS